MTALAEGTRAGASRTAGTARLVSAAKLFALRAWLPVTIVAVWWFATAGTDSLYFPSLQAIVENLRADWLGPHLMQDAAPSVVKFLIGFAIAAVLGVAVGLVIGLSPVLRAATEPVIQFLRSLPPPVLLPIGLLLFGIGATMNVAIIVLGAVWPTLLATIDGVRGVGSELTDMARSYRLTPVQRIRYVILPGAAPQIFGGLRTTLQMSIILIVVSEMVASTSGIGFYVLNSQQTFEVTDTWAGTIVLGLLGYVANLLFIRFERRVLRWQEGRRNATGSE
ncbi:ABC transporter permease [Tomitella gaofuii]|uniref:ABC transporter permease n=1 Tax=Tomitella gaofuii TaxID=2760083 RepID=UPI0015F8708A|nr:ABC transporter permease [Tomitella gaofuii]